MEDLKKQIINQFLKEQPHYRREQVKSVLNLLEDGNTIPFIARYRKEKTGGLDEVQIREISEKVSYLENLEKRKEEVVRIITEQEKMTPKLALAIQKATKLQQIEDLYRPYKQKRRTKATVAKEQGLESLANWIQSFPNEPLEQKAAMYLTDEVLTVEDALQGAHEIIAEVIGDSPVFRTWIRTFIMNFGSYVSEKKTNSDDEKSVFEMYYSFSETIAKVASHRILAMNRGEKEGILKVTLSYDEEKILDYLKKQLIKKGDTPAAKFVEIAAQDALKRFIAPAVEREIRNEKTEIAETQAIELFGTNLRQLLLQSPLKGKVVLGFDPAYRTGCKLAVVDPTGKLAAIEIIYPHKPASLQKREIAGEQFRQLVEKYQVEMIAIGNGTASRESEQFVAQELKKLNREVFYVIVNEAGASVYSASDVAREEFPNLQVEERSAISIGRRLQDPLAELVKIEPKAVGVGQYQHDVSQKNLTNQLDFVVETVVNQVGVDVNTASPQLLQHVSGLNKTTANNIYRFREENGAFTKRSQLKKVPRLGPKAYEQAIGFLRIPDGENVLDNTAIHPESYAVAKKIIDEVGIKVEQLGTKETMEKLATLRAQNLSETMGVGFETIDDILQALRQPGRDMRDEMPAPLLRKDVLTMEDLKIGMELKGTVRNVIDFGAFVDIGVKQDGLVHISKISRRFIKHPTELLAIGDIVTVWIDQVDLKKGRIQLTMLNPYQESDK